MHRTWYYPEHVSGMSYLPSPILKLIFVCHLLLMQNFRNVRAMYMQSVNCSDFKD